MYICMNNTAMFKMLVVHSEVWLKQPVKALTCTVQQAAITPEMGLAESGSNSRSGRRMKSGFNRYLYTQASEVKYTTTCDHL